MMANNRIWLKCLNCGEKLYLGKRMGDAQYWWYDYGGGELGRQLNEFYKKHADCVYREDGAVDNYTIEFEFPTNADKIRAMTDEELSRLLMDDNDVDYGECSETFDCPHSEDWCCQDCIMEWLGEDAE